MHRHPCGRETRENLVMGPWGQLSCLDSARGDANLDVLNQN